MKRKITILGLAVLFIAAGPATPPVEYITIGGTTYGLDRSPSCMNNPTCLRGSARVAREAVVAAKGQMETASKEVKIAEKNLEKHIADVGAYADDANALGTNWSNFITNKILPHNVDAFDQRAANQAAVDAIDEFNRLPPESQSNAAAAALNKELQRTLDWAAIVDGRVIRLTDEGMPIINEKDRLIQLRKDLLAENARVDGELRRAQFKKGEAYRQLIKCADYAREVNELMKKYSMQAADMIELNDADATLKNKSNKMFGEGNDRTGSVLARPTFSVTPNSYSTEPYQVRAQRLINALPPQQRTAVAQMKKSGNNKTPMTDVPAPAVDRSTSPWIVQQFLNWTKKQ